MRPTWWVRFRCWVLGHVWVRSSAGEPVVPVFGVCKRCGKFERWYWR